MAAYLNSTVSMSGDGPHNRFPMSSIPDHHLNSTQNPPLQIFVESKKRINDIFGAIEDVVKDTVVYMRKYENDPDIIEKDWVEKTEEYVQIVHGIRDVLTRDHMKVAFFGRTSNGKSTVINAMLRDKILPSGIGHTTNCFLQVEGSPNEEAYVMLEGTSEHCAVESIRQLGHALCEKKLNQSQLVKVYWPKNRCLLLRDNVVFVDSPGVDVTANLDEWIDLHCLDADVFVLVVNAESTLMVTEKNFFHKVSTRLSKPNIFILNNRWDASANEPEYLAQVRRQHQERAIDFLVKELRLCSPIEAEERIFFISAKEALLTRIAEQGSSSPYMALAEGFENRYLEFENFERKFEECISKSAVKTKFEQHSQRGRFITNKLREALDSILNNAERLKNDKLLQRRDLHNKIDYTQQQLIMIKQDMKQNILNIVKDVKQRVSKVLNEEIRKLGNLVEDFNLPFHSEPLVLNNYKKELHTHVETVLHLNLRERLLRALARDMEDSQREMTERIEVLIPETQNNNTSIILHKRQPFQILDSVNCNKLCADFNEDLKFKFSSGILSTLGCIMIVVTGGIYSCIYLYEKMTWTNKAKEKKFKQQYVSHATRKLKMIVDLTSGNCSHQVQKELNSTFARLCHLVDEATADMEDKLEGLEAEVMALESAVSRGKVLRNKVNYLTRGLEFFEDAYFNGQH